MLTALISFFAVGIPLYNQGVSFPLCFLAQVGLMGLLILGWIFLVEKRHRKDAKHKVD